MAVAQNILLGKGLDDLPFGATQSEVEDVLGKPNETDELLVDDEKTVVWNYWDYGLSMNFDENEGFTLTSMEVAAPEVLLFGKALIGDDKETVKTFLDGQNIGESEKEVLGGLTYPEANLNLWFRSGELSDIQWGIIEK